MADSIRALAEPRNKRSERARAAVLHAADDLLVERGYAGLTIERIAARAGVAKQTIYRWWKSKAEILIEAYGTDVAEDLSHPATGDWAADLRTYLVDAASFLRNTPAGAVYRALVGEAQHNPDVAALLRSRYGIHHRLRTLLEAAAQAGAISTDADLNRVEAQLIGPVLYRVLVTGEAVDADFADPLVHSVLRA